MRVRTRRTKPNPRSVSVRQCAYDVVLVLTGVRDADVELPIVRSCLIPEHERSRRALAVLRGSVAAAGTARPGSCALARVLPRRAFHADDQKPVAGAENGDPAGRTLREPGVHRVLVAAAALLEVGRVEEADVRAKGERDRVDVPALALPEVGLQEVGGDRKVLPPRRPITHVHPRAIGIDRARW